MYWSTINSFIVINAFIASLSQPLKSFFLSSLLLFYGGWRLEGLGAVTEAFHVLGSQLHMESSTSQQKQSPCSHSWPAHGSGPPHGFWWQNRRWTQPPTAAGPQIQTWTLVAVRDPDIAMAAQSTCVNMALVAPRPSDINTASDGCAAFGSNTSHESQHRPRLQ